ncbi:MAG: glycosyltransferase family 39 protein [Planctomycetes bacterium]|nr:glycosyltransferase family 39 protein [Planctomycetota bacterium]
MTDANLPVNEEKQGARRDISPNVGRWLLALICVVFLALRVPVMYLQPGGQDEDCYAVPGWVILRTGVPQLPHVPARNQESVYFGADKALYSEPPLYFYYQSLFYAILPDLYGTGRLASGIAGTIAICLVFQLALRSGSRVWGALWAAALFSLSRWFLFPAISARPDMLCAVLGLLAVWLMVRWTETRHDRWLFAIGVCIGLGGLTHPFAIIYAVQLAIWVAVVAPRWKRVLLPVLLAGVSIIVACAWLPLILQHPQIFRVQFRNQFLHEVGGSLFLRMLQPWESIRYHWFEPQGMIAHIGLWQIVLTFVPLVLATVSCVKRRDRPMFPICILAWSSIYLTSVIIGPHHPVIGYWVYTAALMFVCTGRCVDLLVSHSWNFRPKLRFGVVTGLSSAILLAMIPGAGLRTLYVHLRNWNDENYNAPVFAQKLIDSLPEDALVAVDTQFVFDFLTHDRKVILALTNPVYFDMNQFDYDYLILSRFGIEGKLAQNLPVVLESTRGKKDDIFACYCEIYRRVSHPTPTQ